MRNIYIKIKHIKNFVPAYEFNEFTDKPLLLAKAEQAYFQQVNLSKSQKRYSSEEASGITLKSDVGSLEVVDYSLNGLGIISSVFVGPKTEFQVHLSTSSLEVNRILQDRLLSTVTIKVRWSHASGDSYRSGLQYIGLNEEQKKLLFECFCKVNTDAA